MGSLAERLKRTFVVRLAIAYGESQAGNYAAGLAFNAFMSMFPLLVGMLAIIGLIIRDKNVQSIVETQIGNIFWSIDPAERDSLVGALGRVSHYSGLFGTLAIGGLLWTGTGFFAALEFALDQVFGAPQRNLLRQRLMGLGMFGVFLVAILAAVVLTAAADLLPWVPFVGPILGVLVLFGLMLAIYRVVPNRTLELRQIWPGALLAAALMEIVTLIFPIYGKVLGRFDAYGAFLALFFLLATWLYFVSQAILLGAVLNRMLLDRPAADGLAFNT